MKQWSSWWLGLQGSEAYELVLLRWLTHVAGLFVLAGGQFLTTQPSPQAAWVSSDMAAGLQQTNDPRERTKWKLQLRFVTRHRMSHNIISVIYVVGYTDQPHSVWEGSVQRSENVEMGSLGPSWRDKSCTYQECFYSKIVTSESWCCAEFLKKSFQPL